MDELIEKIRKMTQKHQRPGDSVPLLPGFSVFSSPASTCPIQSLYQPMFCVVVQGAKEVMIGEHQLRYGRGACFVGSVELPVTARMSASDVSLVGTAAQTPQAFGQMSLIANLTELLPMPIVEGVTPSARKQYDVESSPPTSMLPSTLPSDSGFAPLITSVHDIAPSDTTLVT